MMEFESAYAACVSAQLAFAPFILHRHFTNTMSTLCNCPLKIISTIGIGALFHKTLQFI